MLSRHYHAQLGAATRRKGFGMNFNQRHFHRANSLGIVSHFDERKGFWAIKIKAPGTDDHDNFVEWAVRNEVLAGRPLVGGAIVALGGRMFQKTNRLTAFFADTFLVDGDEGSINPTLRIVR